MGSFNGAKVGFGYCGHFPSLSDLTTRLSPTVYAGRIASIEITTGKVQLFFCDGNSWLAVPQDPSSVAITGGTIAGTAFGSLRQVATNSRVNTLFAGANKQTMSRSAHWMRASAVTALKLAYGNWYADPASGELGSGAAATFTASIEYPVGVFTQVTFNGGQPSVSIADLGGVVSDSIAVTIPQNAKFFVRTWYSSAVGIVFSGKPASTAHGEAMTYAASGVVDKTIGGTVTDSGGGGLVTPLAIVAVSNQPAPYLLGDSRVFGSLDTFTGCTFNDQGELARSLGPFMGYFNGGVPSENAQQLATASTRMARRIAIAQAYCTHVVCNLGINDVNVKGRTGAQAYADLQAVWAYFGGMPIIQSTIVPVSTSTDSYATTVNQTTGTGNAERVNLNNLLRASATASGIIELADVVESSRDSGIWAAPGYTSDGIHELQKAAIAIQNSGKLFPGRLTW